METLVESKRIHTGRVISLFVDSVTLPSGQAATREVVRHPGGVCILPILDDGRVVMVRQHRYPLGHSLLEFPAGKLDVEGEAPLDCAKRELWEETGYEASNWECLTATYTAPGFCDEVIHLYRATGLSVSEKIYADKEEENISLVLLTAEELKAAVLNKELTDAKSLALVAFSLL